MRGVSEKRRSGGVARTAGWLAYGGWETLEARRLLSAGSTVAALTGPEVVAGVFVDPAPKGAVVEGEMTGTFSWGEGVESGPSQLVFEPATLSGIETGKVVSLGKLDFFNGIILGGTKAEAVTLTLLVRGPGDGTEPVLRELNVALMLDSTVNTDDASESADWVYLEEVEYPAVVFGTGGERALRLEIIGFGSIGDDGAPLLVPDLWAMEEEGDSTHLLARFSEVDVTDEGVDNAEEIAAFYEDFLVEEWEDEEWEEDEAWEDEEGWDDILDEVDDEWWDEEDEIPGEGEDPE